MCLHSSSEHVGTIILLFHKSLASHINVKVEIGEGGDKKVL